MHCNSLESGNSDDDDLGDREEHKDCEDAMFNAIVASLIDYTGADGNQDESTKKAM